MPFDDGVLSREAGLNVELAVHHAPLLYIMPETMTATTTDDKGATLLFLPMTWFSRHHAPLIG